MEELFQRVYAHIPIQTKTGQTFSLHCVGINENETKDQVHSLFMRIAQLMKHEVIDFQEKASSVIGNLSDRYRIEKILQSNISTNAGRIIYFLTASTQAVDLGRVAPIKPSTKKSVPTA